LRFLCLVIARQYSDHYDVISCVYHLLFNCKSAGEAPCEERERR